MKKTLYATWIWAAGAAVNLVLNYFLIKAYQGMGAALATALSFFFISAATLAVSHRLYPIRFEFGRAGRLILLAIPIYTASRFLPAMHPFAAIPAKCLLLCLYPAAIYLTGFFRQEELEGMGALRAKVWAALPIPGRAG